ncbi:uncharacterized protein LOC110153236 [Boleophthalmus pectinirostris]|uniref:uncharacterized protein LOC110153236 n=1 Tax=Boleophthalmus pectinirostris TaxID=150288 RepID=UPI0024314087|nr:uncharacterized protein LOC110153236 [Boleophthalmus pectinirostris]
MDMCRAALCFLLLRPLTLSFSNQKVFLEKRIGADVDTTTLCTNDTDNFIINVLCQIQKEENGDVCKLQYVAGWKNETECDSRISLMVQNNTVFLRLMDLTPVDSGTYSCSCIKEENILKLHLNVTVQDSGLITVNEQNNLYDNYKFLVISTFGSSLIAFMIIFLVTLCCIYKGNCCKEQTEPPVMEGKEIGQHQMDTYAELQEPTNDLYQTVSSEDLAEVSDSQQSDNETVYENL